MQTLNKFLLILLFPLASWANSVPTSILRVIDGDTIVISAPYLPAPLKPQLSLRIYGIDTPEKGSRAKCAREKDLAEKATTYTRQAVQNSKNHRVIILEWDKYGGRVLGDVILDGRSLRDTLIQNKLARPYNGQAKSNWC